MNRLYSLDYLRGLTALGIMIYHYSTWTLGKFASESFIGRVGIYGVSVFYVLSGITLYFVYYNKMTPQRNEVVDYFKKRAFRIFPLLWLVTILAIILSKQFPDLLKLFLSLTGLFGIFDWDSYFSKGVWSIGNELVFYLFFPFFVYFAKRSTPILILLSTILLAIYVYFAFFSFDLSVSLTYQWRIYSNPLNQVFLFLGGFLIGHVFQNAKIDKYLNLLILILGLAVFIFYPVEGNRVNIVTGINRMVFTLCCFMICFSFYKMAFKFPQIIHKPLTLLGESSYSVYLLHPIVFSIVSIVSNHFFTMSTSLKLIVSGGGTLVLSYFVYEYFEKYFMKKGNSIRLEKLKKMIS